MSVRVLVCGDRKWSDGMRVFNVLASLKAEHGEFVVLEGGASGADECAWAEAHRLNLPVETFAADWLAYGRRAGPIRNRTMLDTKPDLVLAFHENIERSRGTKDCVAEARRRGIPVQIITPTTISTPTTPPAQPAGEPGG